MSIAHKSDAKKVQPPFAETHFPASVSISELMQAGKLVRPKEKQKATLSLKMFDVKSGEWSVGTTMDLLIEVEKFSSGGFRDAFLGTACSSNGNQKWVIKKYNAKAKDAIKNSMKTTEDVHTRKQVQMHTVARHLTKKLSTKIPTEFGQCFWYNQVFYTQFQDEPATIEEFVPGNFTKYINNNGESYSCPEQCTAVSNPYQTEHYLKPVFKLF